MSAFKQFTPVELIGLFFTYSKLSAKVTLEYKLDKILMTFGIFCREMISIIIMYLILVRFVRIKGWEMNEMFFLYSFLFLSYSVFVFFFTGIRDFDNMIYNGTLDRFYLRPVGVMFQVIASRVDYAATIGHGTVGVILLLQTANSVGINWTVSNVLYYLLAVSGGAVIQASLFLISSCFSFWAIRTTNIRNMLFFNARRFAGYPISFYPILIQKLLIYILPFAFVNYFPALYFLGKSEMISFWKGYFYLTPVVGIVMFVLVSRFWKLGLRAYSSSGVSIQ